MIKSNMHNKLTTIKKVIWVITPFLLLTILILLLCRDCNTKKIGEKKELIVEKQDTIVDGELVKKPTNNCRAHFSGLLMTDNFQSDHHTEIYQLDESSEYVGEGEYPRSILAFPKAHESTFDGIAIDKGTRVIIYSEENFNGSILMDETGPKIITNKIRIDVLKSEKIIGIN